MNLDHRAPTLDEVAQAAGVSRSTASRVINGGLRVSPQAQAAVDAAVVELGYAPNRAARSLVTKRTDSIALVVPEPDELILSDPFLAGTLRGVSSALAATDLQLVLLLSRRGDHGARIANYLRSGPVDGAIIASHHRDNALEASLAASMLPAVFVGRPYLPTPGLVFTDVDNVAGGRIATEHLISLGRRRIATIAGPQDMNAGVDRLAGWRGAMQDAGLSAGAVAAGDFTAAGGSAAMRDLLARHPDVDAVFAASDLMAHGALRTLAEHGRSVPGDVAVVGFDDLDTATHTTPPLTSVHNPVVELVREATTMLLTLMAGGPASEPRIFIPRLVRRASA